MNKNHALKYKIQSEIILIKVKINRIINNFLYRFIYVF